MTRWVPARTESRDRFARLRDDLAVYREMTAVSTAVAWCRVCETHHADASGLCPLCRPDPADRLDQVA